MSYFEKYMKYKTKYLNLKQMGAGTVLPEFKYLNLEPMTGGAIINELFSISGIDDNIVSL